MHPWLSFIYPIPGPHSKLQWFRDIDSSILITCSGCEYNMPIEHHLALTRLHRQVALTRSLRQGCSDKVALTRLLWQGCSDKVALTRLLWQGCSDKVALTRLLWQGHSDKVALTRSLWQGHSDKVALTRSLWQGRSDKVALTGCSDRFVWQAHRTLQTEQTFSIPCPQGVERFPCPVYPRHCANLEKAD